MASFISRKRIFRNVAMYLGSSWVLIEAADYFIHRFAYPAYYVDVFMVLLLFGLVSFVFNEWKISQNKPVSNSVVYSVHGLIIIMAITSGYASYNYSFKSEIKHINNDVEKISIAVLPFKNISPDTVYRWLGEGLCDQIIDQLNYIESIDVKSRSASFYFKNKDYNSVQIANLLGVNTLLDGSVTVIDSIIRVSVKLMDPFTGSQIWSQSFERPYGNLLGIQSEIAINIAGKVNAEVTNDELNKIEKMPTSNSKAFELFSKGKYHWNLITPADNKRAHDYFEHAIQLDSNMAVAYAYLGLTYDMFGGYWLGLEPDSAYTIVNDLANKTIEIDPQEALGYFLKSNYEYFYERDYIKGLSTAEKAFNMADTQEDFIWLYCIMLSINKKTDVAMDIITNYIKSNPTSGQAYQGLCLTKLIRDGKNMAVPIEEIEKPCNKAMELDPSLTYNKYYLAELLFFRHKYSESKKHWEELYQMGPAPHFVEGLFRINYYLGDTTTAMQYFEQLKLISSQIKIPYVMVRAYSTLGDIDNAIYYLEQAYEYRDIELVNLWFDSTLDPIRNHPQFKEILDRLKYAGDQ